MERQAWRPGTPDLDGLRAIELIETVDEAQPFDIVFVLQSCGSCVAPDEAMEGRVKWANKARYRVLTRNVPGKYAPYNAVIRVLGTEDLRSDYLAVLVH
jgi:hypothetical protein